MDLPVNGTVADRPIGLDLIEKRWLATAVEFSFGCNSILSLLTFLKSKKNIYHKAHRLAQTCKDYVLTLNELQMTCTDFLMTYTVL